MTDPIADMLARIRNALAVKRTTVDVPYSKTKHAVAAILEREGWVERIERKTDGEQILKIVLKYEESGVPHIRDLKRISKPGHRVFAKKHALPVVLSGMGMAIISTSSGMMTGREAKKRGLGGEIMCEIF